MNSGFSQVTKYLALGLKKLGHDISMTGIQTAYTNDYSYGIEQMPLDVKYVDEASSLYLNLKKVDPDWLVYVGQLDADLNHLVRVFDKQIVYCPVEGRDIPDMMANELKNIVMHGGKIVAQCRYGQEEMRKVGVNAGMIYHGFDDTIFKKMNSFHPYCYYATDVGQNESDPRILYKQGCYDCHYNCYGNTSTKDKCPYYKEEIVSILRMVGGKWDEKEIGISKLLDETVGKFVCGHVGINFGIRKRQERLIKAYAILINESKQMRDRTLLHMHCKPMAMNGVNLIKEVAKLGVSENIIFSYGGTRSNAWTEEAMARLYNTFDVHVSASSSEGFGLSHLESLACGVPNIAPDCSSLSELIGNDKDESKNRGWLANIGEWQMVQDGSSRALVSEKDLALKMKMAYVEKNKMERFGKNGSEWAKQYTWDRIVREWNSLLETSDRK